MKLSITGIHCVHRKRRLKQKTTQLTKRKSSQNERARETAEFVNCVSYMVRELRQVTLGVGWLPNRCDSVSSNSYLLFEVGRRMPPPIGPRHSLEGLLVFILLFKETPQRRHLRQQQKSDSIRGPYLTIHLVEMDCRVSSPDIRISRIHVRVVGCVQYMKLALFKNEFRNRCHYSFASDHHASDRPHCEDTSITQS